MEQWIIETMEQFGYLGILFLIALENIFPPIPSEVILTFGGFMTTTSELTFLGVVLVSTIGSVLGAVILYGLGRFLDADKIKKIVDKYGYILRLTSKDIDKANAWFQKKGASAVFFCRFIPLIRSLISIPAGMSHMHFGLFFGLTTLGTFIWNVVLISVGVWVGDSWETIIVYMDMYSNIVYAALIVGFLLFVIWFIRVKTIKKAD